jgi:ASPIC and UnbV/FG-GAP-like repeat
MRLLLNWRLLVAVLALMIVFGCGDDDDDDSGDDDDDDDSGDDDDDDNDDDTAPWPEYKDYCPEHSAPDASEAIEIQNDQPVEKPRKTVNYKEGDIEAVHFFPEHPFHLKAIKVYFFGPAGKVTVRVHPDHCRSWPAAPYENHHVDFPETDLIEPITIEVEEDAGWVTIDLPSPGAIIYPDETFWIGYWHHDESPYLGQDGETSSYRNRSRFYSRMWAAQNAPFVWGVGQHNFMIHAIGNYFCKKENAYFTEVGPQVGLGEELHYQRVLWTDIDGDTFDDVLFVMDGEDSFLLMQNDESAVKGEREFNDATDDAQLKGYWGDMGTWGDVNNDGALDLFVGVYVPSAADPGARSTVLLNDGAGVFTEVGSSGVDAIDGTASCSAMADYDGDGLLDLYVGQWLVEYPYPTSFDDWLFKGNGDGTFTDVSVAAGILLSSGYPAYGVTWADYDNDGDQDILVSNYGRTNNTHLQNQGDGTFVQVEQETNLHSPRDNPGNTFGSDFGDIDNDGDLDVFLAEISHPRYQPASEPSSLNINQGAPDYDFANVAENAGIVCDEGEIDPSFIDWNNDGRLDLFVSDLYTDHYCRLYLQNEDGTFSDITYFAGISVHDCTNNAWADFDKDGDLDLLTTQRYDGFHVRLYRNDVGQDNNWVTVRVTGTTTNASGVGARITVVSGDLSQIREVKAGKGHFSSQDSLAAEFGLGENTAIDEIRVQWSGGTEETWTGMDINSFVNLIEGDATVHYDPSGEDL